MTRYKKEGLKKVVVRNLNNNKSATCYYGGDPNVALDIITKKLNIRDDTVHSFDTVTYYCYGRNVNYFYEIDFVEEDYIGGYIR